MTPILKTEAFILAGGKSSRMGRDKGLIEIDGRPMTAHLIDTLKNLGMTPGIISNNPAYEQFGLPVIPDIIKDQGPLGGLYTTMRWTRAANVLLVSCDMPFVSEEALKSLLDAIQPGRIVAAKVNDRLNPMPAIYPIRLKEKIKSLILAQKLKMSQWLSEQNPVVVTLGMKPYRIRATDSDELGDQFININTPDDLRHLGHKQHKLKENPDKTKDII
ncbi:molybdenum cofactor guanylyltransferase [Geofilum rubicundum]|uniref:Probable molybdenum cofactor guanylyltransferase n=1 Tax=Geofilum rubicundum JCM 15548 TaxID=1236989 RepID=A0A0E9LYN8_9BACT|nr:molybdenum cofactor guanylyltransferase [Geofilum rubicundum]GAO30702.1 molybdopterin-guanine dinucleotide biosynthesis protein MobA [Geofilum rubicundum JCM 15548]